ncbi:MAG: ISKra4 family transposase [Burkholderiaceae bacterium]
MRCSIVLEFQDDGAGRPQRRVALMCLHRDSADPLPGDVGLTLVEGKALLFAIQQQFVEVQIEQFCARRRTCEHCGIPRRLHDGRCSELKTVFGSVFFCRDRWKACVCGADQSRYLSPLKEYLPVVSTAELRWLHATPGARLPYRQAHAIMQLLLPMGGRHNHVTLRNHALAVGASVQADSPLQSTHQVEREAELGIDVGYVRQVKGRGTSSMAIVTVAVGAVGKSPRIWASALTRTKPLHDDMAKFLSDSGYNKPGLVRVITDGALDQKKVSAALPHSGCWVLDWAHIGRMLRHLDQAVAPFAYGRITASGSAFELWDLFVRFRCYVWTGQKRRWRSAGDLLHRLMVRLDRRADEYGERPTRQARSKTTLLSYLEANHRSLIDYRRWQKEGRRISTGFVESTINRLIDRRLCKEQQMRWTREGAHALLQVRAALLNGELEARVRRWYPWVGGRRISWPWQMPSHPF